MAHHDSGYDSTSRTKRQKMSDTDPAKNPYLAHMYEEQAASNGHRSNGASRGTGLSNAKRHQSTSAMCTVAEDGPLNPFNAKPLSQQYFNILNVRRKLPVHAQRYVLVPRTKISSS